MALLPVLAGSAARAPRRRVVGARAVGPAAGLARLAEEVGDVAHARDPQVLDRAGRGLAYGRGHLGRAALGRSPRRWRRRTRRCGQIEPRFCGSCTWSRATIRAGRRLQELARRDVRIAAGVGADALMAAEPHAPSISCAEAIRTFRPLNHGSCAALAVAQNRRDTSSTTATQRLAHRVAPVDDHRDSGDQLGAVRGCRESPSHAPRSARAAGRPRRSRVAARAASRSPASATASGRRAQRRAEQVLESEHREHLAQVAVADLAGRRLASRIHSNIAGKRLRAC